MSRSSMDAIGFWSRLTQWWSRPAGKASAVEPRLVKVWDASRGIFRDVDLNDRYDLLWPVANEQAMLQAQDRREQRRSQVA